MSSFPDDGFETYEAKAYVSLLDNSANQFNVSILFHNELGGYVPYVDSEDWAEAIQAAVDAFKDRLLYGTSGVTDDVRIELHGTRNAP